MHATRLGAHDGGALSRQSLRFVTTRLGAHDRDALVIDLLGVTGLVGKMEVYNVYICRYKVGIENSSIYIILIDLFEKMEVYNM